MKKLKAPSDATRRIVRRERDDETGAVTREVVVDFDDRGIGDASDEDAAFLLDRVDGLREAKASDLDAWDRADATPGAAALGRREGVAPGDVDGTGADGRITKRDVRDAASAAESGDDDDE